MSASKKLYDFQADPPPAVWDRISSALEADQPLAGTGKRLYDLQPAPPAGAWDRISAELHGAAEEPVASVVSINRPRKPVSLFFRYAAAAMVIVTLGIWVLTKTGDEPAEALSEQGPVLLGQPPARVPIRPAEQYRISAAKPDTEQNTAGNEEIAVSRPARPAYAVNRVEPRTTQNRINPDQEPVNPLYAYEDHVPSVAERYIMLMTPDGGFIRISKKLGELICCVSGQEQDAACKTQLKKWQKEVATSPVAPGPGNVMDILDLVNSLNDPTQL